MTRTIDLTKQLISRPSLTPNDAGCQNIIADRLSKLGFISDYLKFNDVDNLWARRGQKGPLFVFAGHTDVVPTGPESLWTYPPFEPTVKEGFLYGRGAADMKGSIAAMIIAVENFVAKHNNHKGSIAFLITSDEEGPAVDGTAKVISWLQSRGEQIDICIVGEPTSSNTIADTIKNGRRGSLNGNLKIHGIQGHIAYPQLAENPIHAFSPLLQELCTTQWDTGNEFFPATSFQISNISAGTGATNVIPGSLEITFNFRYSSSITHEQLQDQITNLLNKHQLKFELEWSLSGKPFLTPPCPFIDTVNAAIEEITGKRALLSTSGGTSDGRFIAPTGAQVIELGPSNQTIHKINECVKVDDLNVLTKIYELTLDNLLK